MQFIIFAKDGEDPEAPERRKAARESHLTYSEMAVKTGEQIFAAATLNEMGGMNGSVMVVEFDDIEGVKEWLDKEAYVTGDVWQDIQGHRDVVFVLDLLDELHHFQGTHAQVRHQVSGLRQRLGVFVHVTQDGVHGLEVLRG